MKKLINTPQITKPMKNIFIVLDGLDGSGKGEMINRLHNYLFSKSKDYKILSTREPSSGKYGKEIRELLKTEKDPKANAENFLDLYIKDREDHLKETILPFLNSATNINIVIWDRYYYSTIAFQHTQGIELNKVIELNKDFKQPDIAFILDLPPEIALERIGNRGKQKEKFEQLEFMQTLRKNFLELKQHITDNIKIIDASKTKEEVFNQIKKEIDILLT